MKCSRLTIGERWPGTRAPRSQAGNPEGDEEVPQDWGTWDGERWLSTRERRGVGRESLLAARAASGQEWGLRRRPGLQRMTVGWGSALGQESREMRISKGRKQEEQGGLKDIAGPTSKETGFNTGNTALRTALARRIAKQ
ncbi:hypothetical protein PPACK8108_LOCUS19153 [Phakopsora pachyrhizi]|uniref:Uncharacterized protein n=1 Tax=Phakopsora pachyrhizi TaxID=170000 RepID=A0AAV0BFD9_PHAPC|nr:hypothetical protein PPACK8108_LOCUS19153 [Phakopsora pachyrhizi]